MAWQLIALTTLPEYPDLNSQNPHGSSKLPVTPVPRNLTHPSHLCRHYTNVVHGHACRRNARVHKIEKKNKITLKLRHRAEEKDEENSFMKMLSFRKLMWLQHDNFKSKCLCIVVKRYTV